MRDKSLFWTTHVQSMLSVIKNNLIFKVDIKTRTKPICMKNKVAFCTKKKLSNASK